MAEIKIEKKKPVWPWVILAIVLIGIAYFIYASQEDDDYNDDTDINEIENTNEFNGSDSTSYDSSTMYGKSSNDTRELSEVMKDSTRFGTDSMYTSKALDDLVKRTLNTAKNHQLMSSSTLNDLELYTTTDRDSEVTSSAKNFKMVSDDIVEVLETLQSNHAPGLQQKVKKLKDNAAQINAATDLSKQQETLQAFIRNAHDVLNNLNI